MNRVLKFRIWDGEKMRLLDHQFIGVGQIGFSDEHYVDLNDYDHEDVQVMQYTGLKDKNGVEIYEGDIIKCNDYKRIQEVQFLYGEFTARSVPIADDWVRLKSVVIGGYDGGEDNEHIDGGCEVIGNVYQHGHLLEDRDA